MANKLSLVLFGVLEVVTLIGCGGSNDAAPEACQTRPPLPVENVFYPSESATVGANVSIVPTLAVTTGNGLNSAILRFDLIGGSLPSGLSLNPGTGRISGVVDGSRGSFSYTVRVSAECFTGTVTTTAAFFVS